MEIAKSKKFDKQFLKLSSTLQQKVIDRFFIFKEDCFSPILNNHPLKGEWSDHRSINITADIRAVYKMMGKNRAYFVVIGSHSELYE